MPKGLKGFQKGHKSFSTKGRFKPGGHPSPSTEFKKGQTSRNKGLTASQDEGVKRFVEAGHKARKGKPAWNKGIKMPPLTEEHKNKISVALRGKYTGPQTSNWKGGISEKNKAIRSSRAFQRWRGRVFKRDDWTCQECGDRGGHLHPHHVKPFADFPELRLEDSNGITLCAECHKKTKTWGARKKRA